MKGHEFCNWWQQTQLVVDVFDCANVFSVFKSEIDGSMVEEGDGK